MSSSEPRQLGQWQIFFETALAVTDICDTELQAEVGFTLRWYDVLVHLEDEADGLQMNELASHILSSKSGLTRVVDRMCEEGLVRRDRSLQDRRVVRVVLTPKGHEQLLVAREAHHQSIQRHFFDHLSAAQLTALADALEGVRDHVRPLRPGRVT